MFRNEYTAKIGYTRLLDRACQNCGGLYSSFEHSSCPKCQGILIIPAHQTEQGPRQYCMTEVTLYPMMRKEVKDIHTKRTSAAKGLLYVITMVLWGRYDKERNVLEPDPRTRYLVPKRTIRVLFNSPPTVLPYTAMDGSDKLEWKYTFDTRGGDQIEFLDAKQESSAMMSGATAMPTDTVPNNAADSGVKAKLDRILAALKHAGITLPTDVDSAMYMDDVEDYGNKPSMEGSENDPF